MLLNNHFNDIGSGIDAEYVEDYIHDDDDDGDDDKTRVKMHISKIHSSCILIFFQGRPPSEAAGTVSPDVSLSVVSVELAVTTLL